jgi:hypothetical protein
MEENWLHHESKNSKHMKESSIELSFDNQSYDDFVNCKTTKYNDLMSRQPFDSRTNKILEEDSK